MDLPDFLPTHLPTYLTYLTIYLPTLVQQFICDLHDRNCCYCMYYYHDNYPEGVLHKVRHFSIFLPLLMGAIF